MEIPTWFIMVGAKYTMALTPVICCVSPISMASSTVICIHRLAFSAFHSDPLDFRAVSCEVSSKISIPARPAISWARGMRPLVASHTGVSGRKAIPSASARPGTAARPSIHSQLPVEASAELTR